MFRVVATEETGIDDDATNNAWQAESNDAPIEAGCSPPAALPAIHPLAPIRVFVRNKDRRTGLKKVLLGRKKIIIRHKHRATEWFRGKIDQFNEVHKSLPALRRI